MGAAGLVAKHFAADNPTAIASRRVRLAVKKRDAMDPSTIYGNNREVPVPVWYKEDVLKVLCGVFVAEVFFSSFFHLGYFNYCIYYHQNLISCLCEPPCTCQSGDSRFEATLD